MTDRTALVVDDSRSARFAMRKFLEAAGYRVLLAESAADAYRALESCVPDVLFLDHVMPDVDGFEALAEIRRAPRTAAVPVVLCSSNEGTDFVQTAQGLGALAVLLKPPSPQQIGEVLRTIGDGAAARAEPPPPAVAKVQLIREPEVQIENAVMKSLRDALPAAPPATVAVPAAEVQPAVALAPPTLRVVAGADAPSLPSRPTAPVARPDALRAEMEARLLKITQALHAELAEVRARLAHLDGEIRREDQIRGLVAEALDEQFALLTRSFEARLAGLRCEIDDVLTAQNARIERMGSELRALVAAEAHAVSERVVMNAASSISDQIAASILSVLRPSMVAGGAR